MKQSDDNPTIPKGKHAGESCENVPASYLLWLNDQPWFRAARAWREVADYVATNFDWLQREQTRDARSEPDPSTHYKGQTLTPPYHREYKP